MHGVQVSLRRFYRHMQQVYEAKDERTFMCFIAMQPLVADHAFMPHMKAMNVFFHMAYSGLI